MKYFLPVFIKAAFAGALACLALVACEDDDPVKPVDNQPPQYKSLTVRENVLYNLQLSYNKRNATEYEKLLDNGFKFYPAAEDVAGGLSSAWSRLDEIAIHGRLFDPNYTGSAPACTGIQFNLVFEDGVTWTEVPAGAESWYTTTAYYNFVFFMNSGPNAIINLPGSKAQFTVRNAGTGEAPQWQLVEIRDQVDPTPQVRSAATEPSTWGRVKARYRTFEDLSQNWHVLKDVERAYNERAISAYTALLDQNFTFFLSAGDVGGGLPESWGRAVEVQANTNLFSQNPPDGRPRATSIQLDVQWEDESGNPAITWTALPNSGPNADETWYTTSVFYDFQISVEPDITWINSPGSKAQFTVRNAGTGDAPRWQLVEMRDLGGPELVGLSLRSGQTATWGAVKALYR